MFTVTTKQIFYLCRTIYGSDTTQTTLHLIMAHPEVRLQMSYLNESVYMSYLNVRPVVVIFVVVVAVVGVCCHCLSIGL